MDNMIERLDKEAVEIKTLSSNFAEIASGCDCPIEDAEPRSVIQNNFPLVNWLVGTTASQSARRRFNLKNVSWDENNKPRMAVPGSFWTTAPTNTGEECCWVKFDFAKCCGDVGMNLLCLKDCNTVFEELVNRDLRVSENMRTVARAGETVETVERRLARLSMAFYTAHTAILGREDTYTDLTKPFHGLIEVMDNPAVPALYAYDIYGIFEELKCRLDVLGGYGNYVIACHPLIFNSIEAAIQPDRNGNYPDGWSRRDGELRFRGIRFLRDKLMPINMEDGTGEAWLLDGQSVGLFLGTNLMVENSFIKESGIDTSVDNCGASCTYYYNYGAAFGNNANRIAKIVNIPINSACMNVLGDIAGLIQPNTLIPNGVVA